MALRVMLGWIGITVGGLLLLALVDVTRVVVRGVRALFSRRVGKPALDPQVSSSPSRAR